MTQAKTYKIDFGGRNLTVELNNWADQTNGSAYVRYGDTIVLATAVMSKYPREGANFFPLIVDYQEKFYASGKIKGSRFVKREGRPSDEATLNGRMIDRALRPRFDMRIRNDVQIIANVLSFDPKNDPDIPSLIASSCALAVSDIPWRGPVGAVKVGRINGEYALNPSQEDAPKSDFLITLAGTKDKINMIEASARETPEEELAQAFEFGLKQIKKIIEFQEEIIKESGRAKLELPLFEPSEDTKKEVNDFLGERLKEALFQQFKKERLDAVNVLKDELKAYLEQKHADDAITLSLGLDFFEEKVNEIVHESILKEGKRVDGRKLDELRDLSSGVAVLPRVHGSGLFMRGNTHALGSVTLAPPGMEQIIDEMEPEYKKRFMLHYNFPPFSVGEVAPLRSPGRREIGHGALAEKALEPTLPSKDDFPYAIRIVSEILSSNGSSSMASVCAGSLALMDAGVPIKKPAAGIAMGLMTDDQADNYKVLTDIQGPEDHHGDMDFKAAGTKDGVTAIQMDVKIEGVTTKMLQDTLLAAKKARKEILEHMAKTITESRPNLSPYAPRIMVVQINPEKIGDVIGPAGKTINEIIEKTGVLSIDIEDDGKIYIAAAPEKETAAVEAVSWIKNITREIKIGDTFDAKVVRVADFGAFVELTPKHEGLAHISELSDKYVRNVSDVVKVGDTLRVKVIRIDEQGKIAVSAKTNGGGKNYKSN